MGERKRTRNKWLVNPYKIWHGVSFIWGFPGSSDGKESACNGETQVQFLGWEDPLEKEMATHSSILTWQNSMDRGAWQATIHGATKSWKRLSD